ncbi:MAG: M55 family metallopeptidase [Anaerovoracaceae bacterium]|jgi:D-amino peptidase
MKVFISSDLEGVTGVTRWEETRFGGQGYEEACARMTRETAAACEAAQSMGASVIVKDGHEDAVNIDIDGLPRGVELIRGWRSSPAAMMGGLDETFDAALYIGYHSPAGSDTNPLAHTTEYEWFHKIILNGRLASEFSLNALWAAAYHVPSVFLSGDQGMCDLAKESAGEIVTVPTKTCVGGSTWNRHPDDVLDEIYKGVKESLSKKQESIPLEEQYRMEIEFRSHQSARAASWYPGAVQKDANTVIYTAKDPIELITAKMFMTEII